jgi:hypothetical protein
VFPDVALHREDADNRFDHVASPFSLRRLVATE